MSDYGEPSYCSRCEQLMQSAQSIARGYCQRCAWTVPGLQRPTYPVYQPWSHDRAKKAKAREQEGR